MAQEIPQANDSSDVTEKLLALGYALEAAFHDKQNIEKIKALVQEGAPVNYRLDYGLEIKLEADFVAGFRLLLGGDISEAVLLSNAKKIVGDEHGQGLADYVKTSQEIFDILYDETANKREIKVNPAFAAHLKEHASDYRANPEGKNGSLIIAAGLRSPELVEELIKLGRAAGYQGVKTKDNGADVNFKGFFDDTAAVWSAILLDKPTLEILVENRAETENLGVTGSSLLHWVAVVARLDNSVERKAKAEEITKLLLAKGLRADIPNKLGKTAFDYAKGELLEMLNRDPSIKNSAKP